MKKTLLILVLSFPVLLYILSVKTQEKLPKINLPVPSERIEIHNQPSEVPKSSVDIYQCNINDDCVVVSVGKCCDFTSVNKKYRNEIEFVPMVCTQYCPVTAACKNNACQVMWAK
ncbi:hypothetical protein ISS85_00510 [Candidatus Microgenomates bacterium]|nr:hypothetical protein [Candidatus Microgenomates bacterium]